MWMGGDDDIDTSYAPLTQKWHDDTLAEVHASTPDAGVDDHRTSVGEAQKGAVSLRHVEEDDLQSGACQQTWPQGQIRPQPRDSSSME